MTSFNKILLMGNLTRDPQLSYTPSQTAVVDFGLATNRRWTAQDGNQREETCFVDCRAFGRLAENINKYMSKGRPIFIEGRLTFDTWTAQDGTKRSKHRVTVENFRFLPGGGGGGGGAGGAGQGDQGYGASSAPGPERPQGPGAVPDDEIPF
jgi:single-strand DNA-binding protein